MKYWQFFGLLVLLTPLDGTERISNPPAKQKEEIRYPEQSWTSLAPPAPKYFKSPMILEMTPQSGNTCLPSLMAYLNQVQCNGHLTTAYYIDQYERGHEGVDVEEDGIVGSKREVVEYIRANFNTMFFRSAGGLVASIDAGYPLMTTIISFDESGQQQIHSVLIVGYDSAAVFNPKVYYMDPRYGHIFNDLDVVKFNNSTPAYAFSILGCKK